jgi:hypothetical protein
MVQVSIDIDKNKFKGFGADKIKEIEEKGLKYVGQDLLRNLQKNSPVDTGHLRKWAVIGGFGRGTLIDIRSPAIYGVFVNDGTGIYGPRGQIIRPKKGKFMVFKPGKKWKGPVVKSGKFKGKVVLQYSRGQKGQKFVEKSIGQTQEKIGSLFISAIRDVMQ